MSSGRPRVVIVGAGFGGLHAAKALAKTEVDVVLLDRNNYHLFQPLLYQVAVAALPPAEIAYPVRPIVRRIENVAFRVAEVTGCDLARKVVITDRGEVPYDALVVAAGAATNDFGLPGIAEHAFDLKSLPDALRLRNHVLRCFERAVASGSADERRALLTIVVAGGGPTGVEVAGAASELLRRVLGRDYPALSRDEIAVHLLEAGPRVLAAFPTDLAEAAAKALARIEVVVETGVKVAGYDGASVRLAGGRTIPARTLVWAAGVAAAPLASMLGLPARGGGRIVVEPTLEVAGQPGVFVIGDAAYLEAGGAAVPMLAPPAIQMGACAAGNVRRRLRGEPLVPFRYRDPGTLATIGRSAAVASIRGFHLRGFPAWIVWLFVHLMQLVGFRNRVVVFVDWAWQYLLYRPASPIILEAAPRPRSD
ncbi:MAG TPA: NAD(P)/FAD-dependent oxidoreductase [Candidatus Polarisedimenticolaceae bacterium]|nr:NAD(P)/FAD-dependent oxidoreductase [Candidatus Polarisedimenticolaceae bacterium]